MKRQFLVLMFALTALIISGCYGGGFSSPDTGTLVLKITDIPKEDLKDVMYVFVTLSNIEVHKAAANEPDNAVTETGWSMIVDQPQTFDLLSIKDAKEFLGSATLESGKYNQIRLNVDEALLIFNDESRYNLKIPPGKIMLIKPFFIEKNQQTTLLLDFDAEESIHKTGKDDYIMNPTIKVIQE